MGKALKKPRATAQHIEAPTCGVFMRLEAAQHVIAGVKHLHSTSLGKRDPLLKQTIAALDTNQVPQYTWEKLAKTQSISIFSSKERHLVIEKVINSSAQAHKKSFREKAKAVVEELLSNAIFHAYRRNDGAEKYRRTEIVNLSPAEAILLTWGGTAEGVFVNIKDQGGSLNFEDMRARLERCYSPHAEIESKESGAGLGTYLVFETVSHFKLVITPGKQTDISIWLASDRKTEPTIFTFNVFERR